MEKLYPGFVMRIYHNFNSTEEFEPLLCDFPNLDLCYVRNLAIYGDIARSFGMIWRYAPMADPTVDEWHSRDLDSLVSEREAAAVADWRSNSDASYHSMRDNPYHSVSIMGGMFGMRLTGKRNRFWNKMIFESMIKSSVGEWMKGIDQKYLSIHLWPSARYDMVCHDSYLCKKLRCSDIRSFPTRRNMSGLFNFVGSNGGILEEECPSECRPKKHPDWNYC